MVIDYSPFWISLKTVSVATGITLVFGLALAYRMVFGAGRWRTVVDTVVTLPMVLPPTVVGFILLLIFGNHTLIGQLLRSLGITIIFSWPATVIAAVVVSFPLLYRTACGAFEQLDRTLIDAARTLGSSSWRIFWLLIFPVTFPGICAGLVLAFARALGEFGATLMLAGNLPGQTQTIPLAIYFAVDRGDMATATFWTVVVLLLSFTTLALLNYWVSRPTKGTSP